MAKWGLLGIPELFEIPGFRPVPQFLRYLDSFARLSLVMFAFKYSICCNFRLLSWTLQPNAWLVSKSLIREDLRNVFMESVRKRVIM